MVTKFIVTRKIALDGSVIYPGTYKLEWKNGLYFLSNEDFGWFATKEELLKCGYVENHEPLPFCYT